MQTYKMLIGGAWQDAAGGDTFETENPFLGAPWALVPRGTVADVDAAVAAARAAFRNPDWRKISASARGALLHRLGDLIAREAERLAAVETRDNGKLITEMRGQLKYIPQWFYYFGGLADKIEGRVIPIDKPGMVNFTREEPLGVVAAITPWNSPLMLATWKLAPALAAGNTVVWKPSEFSSVSALELGPLFEEAGFPPGVVNILTGFGSEIGERLVSHPDVAKVAFTGGDRTGQSVYELAARSIKPVTLELGGKSANIVFADATIENAVKGTVSGIFAATGQTCIAGSRLLVQNSIRDKFVQRVKELGATARKGNPMLPDTNIGPVTTPAQYRKILDYMEIAKAEGARCILGGGPASSPDLPGGQFVEPTIFVDVTPQMRIAREEVFGPVLSVIGFDDEADAIRTANDTIYGLAAGVWTGNIGRALRMSQALKAGTVWVNTYRAVSYMMPFGGMKHSGIGRESGIASIEQYLETKSTWISYAQGAPANPFVMR